MVERRRLLLLLVVVGLVGLLALGCRAGAPVLPPTPTKTRLALVLPTNTPVPSPTPQPSSTSTPPPTASPAAVMPISSPPPPTDAAPATSTRSVAAATSTPLSPGEAATSPPTAVPFSPQPPPATPTPKPQPPLPPQQGAEWDMEAGFTAGTSPMGEDCPGWAVAVGWQAFLAPGAPASSCLNENKNLANVKSGERSQEITFDFIQAEAGIYRQAETLPGNRYQVEAWGKHVRSASPVELSLGVDLTGGEDWQAASVTWHPWDETGEDIWVHTQVVIKASGETLTVFLKGYHPIALQGGATLFDDVRVLDLGP